MADRKEPHYAPNLANPCSEKSGPGECSDYNSYVNYDKLKGPIQMREMNFRKFSSVFSR